MDRAIVSILLVFAVGCVTATPVIPGPIVGLGDPDANRSAIYEAMAMRGWAPESEEPGRILVRYQRARHVGKIWVEYDADRISFEYGGSENMRCLSAGDSCYKIHKVYNRWASNLAQDISLVLMRERGPPPVAAGSTP